MAATDNRLALARLLLDRGADPGAQCQARPSRAAQRMPSPPQTLRLTLAAFPCCRAQERQCTPLHDAVDGGHVEMAKFLISRHAPPDMFDLVRPPESY